MSVADFKAPDAPGFKLDLKVVAKRKEGFKNAIRVFMIWKPNGISSLGEQTIAEGQNECTFQLDANAAAPADRAVVARARELMERGDSTALTEQIDALNRTRRMFKGVVGKSA